jgi:putative ABC transport system substrate-binding protein
VKFYLQSGLRMLLVAVAGWMAMIVVPPVLAEARIVVIGSQEKTPYRLFVEGFRGFLGKREPGLEYDEAAMRADGKGDASLLLTLGPATLRSVLEQEPATPVIAGLTRDRQLLESHAGVTGVVLEYGAEIQLAWIKRILPDYRTIGVLYNPEKSAVRIAAAKKAAAKLGLNLVAQAVDSPKELPVAMESLFRRVDVLWGITDPVVLSRKTAKAILLTSFRNKVPFVAPSPAWVKAGALYSLNFDYRDLGVQSGEIALDVLQGRQIASIPLQEPREVRYTLNLRTAQHMRLKLPGALVNGADRVFK